MDFRNAKELLELCRQADLSISEIMRQREIEQGETTGEEADCRMAKAYEIMQQSARTPVNTPGRSMGGLIGGEAKRLSEHQKSGKSMCGSLLGKAICARRACACQEENRRRMLLCRLTTGI